MAELSKQISADVSSAVVRLRQQGVATPQSIAVRQVMADGIIAVAAKAKDWPLLFEAVSIKIEDQREFVVWWADNVRPPGQGNIADRRYFSLADAQRQSGITKQQVSRWRKSLEDPQAYHAKLVLAASRKANLEVAESHRVNTGEYEWYTPERYIVAARRVMGGIDLDPATHCEAQKTVRATRYYTAADDGLKHAWRGNVWLNPPYAQPLMQSFVAKLLEEVRARHTAQAIMLTHNYTDTAWFHEAQATAALLCFTRGRIAFVGADGPPTQGQAFFYFGKREKQFRAVFGGFGFIR